MGKTYVGIRDTKGCKILVLTEIAGARVSQVELPLHRDVCDFSLGFEWGYVGDGPAQTALALLVDQSGNNSNCPFYVDELTYQLIACLPACDHPGQDWEMSDRVIEEFILNFRENLDGDGDWAMFRASVSERGLIECNGRFLIS